MVGAEWWRKYLGWLKLAGIALVAFAVGLIAMNVLLDFAIRVF